MNNHNITIWELTRTGDFQFNHIFREGNKIADQLANLGEVTKTHGIFNQVVSLPREVRASLKFEQEEIPNFRFRVKRNFFLYLMISSIDIRIRHSMFGAYVYAGPSFVNIDVSSTREESIRFLSISYTQMHFRLVVINVQYIIEAKVYILLRVIKVLNIQVGVRPNSTIEMMEFD